MCPVARLYSCLLYSHCHRSKAARRRNSQAQHSNSLDLPVLVLVNALALALSVSTQPFFISSCSWHYPSVVGFTSTTTWLSLWASEIRGRSTTVVRFILPRQKGFNLQTY